jgi:hypothetical protein
MILPTMTSLSYDIEISNSHVYADLTTLFLYFFMSLIPYTLEQFIVAQITPFMDSERLFCVHSGSCAYPLVATRMLWPPLDFIA